MSSVSRSKRKLASTTSRRSALRSCSRVSARISRESTRRRVLLSKKSSIYQDVDTKDPCVCGPNFYQKVFGPTADETILVGLQTVIGLCEECPPQEDRRSIRSSRSAIAVEEEEDDDDEEEIPEVDERPSCSDTLSNITRAGSKEIKQCCCSQTDDLKVASGSQTDCNTTTNICVQTVLPSMKTCSEVRYAQCAAEPNSCPALSAAKEDKCMCTDPSTPPCSHRPQASKSAQYSKSQCASKPFSSSKVSSDSCCCCVGTESEETPPSCCCSTPTSKSKSKRKSSFKTSSLCSCCQTALETTTNSKRCTCSSSSGKRQKQVTMCCECSTRASSSSTDDVENRMETGDSNEVTIRYAITKITKFLSYTTFEVMKSTSKKPKVMPKKLEGVFVLRNCVCCKNA